MAAWNGATSILVVCVGGRGRRDHLPVVQHHCAAHGAFQTSWSCVACARGANAHVDKVAGSRVRVDFVCSPAKVLVESDFGRVGREESEIFSCGINCLFLLLFFTQRQNILCYFEYKIAPSGA